MDIPIKTLEEALAIRREIDNLQKRLSSILGGAASKTAGPTTRAKLSAAAKARWAGLKRGTRPAAAKKKGALTPAGRKRLSQLMKARWAARRKAADFGPGPGRVRLLRS
jgi:hypothetical protein